MAFKTASLLEAAVIHCGKRLPMLRCHLIAWGAASFYLFDKMMGISLVSVIVSNDWHLSGVDTFFICNDKRKIIFSLIHNYNYF